MKLSWKEAVQALRSLINEVSNGYGGDDEVWLDDYCKEIISIYKNDIFVAIDAFDSLVNQVRPTISKEADHVEMEVRGT